MTSPLNSNAVRLEREFITQDRRMLVKQYQSSVVKDNTRIEKNFAVTVKKNPTAISGTKYVFAVYDGDLNGKKISTATIVVKT